MSRRILKRESVSRDGGVEALQFETAQSFAFTFLINGQMTSDELESIEGFCQISFIFVDGLFLWFLFLFWSESFLSIPFMKRSSFIPYWIYSNLELYFIYVGLRLCCENFNLVLCKIWNVCRIIRKRFSICLMYFFFNM